MLTRPREDLRLSIGCFFAFETGRIWAVNRRKKGSRSVKNRQNDDGNCKSLNISMLSDYWPEEQIFNVGKVYTLAIFVRRLRRNSVLRIMSYLSKPRRIVTYL